MGYLKEPYILYRQHGNNQVGIVKASHSLSKLSQVRDLSIKMKIGIFETYVEKEEFFPEKLRKQNREVLAYLQMLQNKKNINVKNWSIFYQIFKTESMRQFVLNFMVLNMPIIVKPIFAIRYQMLKQIGKRK